MHYLEISESPASFYTYPSVKDGCQVFKVKRRTYRNRMINTPHEVDATDMSTWRWYRQVIRRDDWIRKLITFVRISGEKVNEWYGSFLKASKEDGQAMTTFLTIFLLIIINFIVWSTRKNGVESSHPFSPFYRNNTLLLPSLLVKIIVNYEEVERPVEVFLLLKPTNCTGQARKSLKQSMNQ